MYEAFYKLSARPFQLIPDPRLLFESRNHKRALSYLLYGLERREGFVVITGDVGMGKTLLVQTLLGELRSRNLSIARVAMANLDAASVLPTVASAFGLPHKSRSKIELLDDLVGCLLPAQSRGSLLIVDEAQTCTPQALEELRAISNLQANGQALVQVFLVGQTDLRDKLSQPNMAHLRQRIVAAHHLQPLDLGETRSYIKHRLRAVGWRANPRLEDDVFPVAHEWSHGVPRRLNMLMDRFLLYGFLEQLTVLTGKDLKVVISEFEDEFTDDAFVFGTSKLSPTQTTPATNSNLGALNSRVFALERALSSAFGRKRAAELMEKHEALVENRDLLAAQMRVARLESLFSEVLGDTSSTDEETVEPSDTPPAEELAQEASVESPADEPDMEFEIHDAPTETNNQSLADTIDAITPAASYGDPGDLDDPYDADNSTRWRLFSRRR